MWKNGGGVTRELAAEPSGATTTDFDWRVSVADVTVGGPFSAFPGVDRVITLIEGTGMSITVDGVRHELVPHAPFAFSGDADTTCALASAATRDLNVMTRRGRRAASVEVLSVASTSRLVAQDGTVLLVVVQGETSVEEEGTGLLALGALDALLCDGPVSLVLRGRAVVSVISIATSTPE